MLARAGVRRLRAAGGRAFLRSGVLEVNRERDRLDGVRLEMQMEHRGVAAQLGRGGREAQRGRARMPVRAVIFECDGTVLHGGRADCAALDGWAQEATDDEHILEAAAEAQREVERNILAVEVVNVNGLVDL